MMDRRTMIGSGLAGYAALLAPAAAQAASAIDDPFPPRPAKPTPGKLGDFDFLQGEWRIAHRMLSGGKWIEFAGEATCWTILGGIGSVEELRIPARDFSGMGLRMLDVKERVWSDFWVNAKSGVLTSPGMTGSFERGAGVFMSDYEEEGRKMISAGVWDRIAPGVCRWRQASSGDGGRTWAPNWIMEWRRV